MKKRIWLFTVVFGTVSLLSIPCSMYFIEIPSVLTPIFCGLTLFFLIVSLKMGLLRGGRRIGISLFAVFAVFGSVLGNFCNPYWNSIWWKDHVPLTSENFYAVLSRQEAEADFRYAMYYLKKLHPALYDGMPDAVALRAEDVADALAQTSEISVLELNRMLQSVVSCLHDGHTYIKALPAEQHVRRSGEGVLFAVNGISVDELLRQTQDLYSYESESWHWHLLKHDLSTWEGLQYLDLVSGGTVIYTERFADGESVSYSFSEQDFSTDVPQKGENAEPFVSYEIDEMRSLAILTLHACEYNEVYVRCLREMFTQIRQKQIRHLAIDLRANGGGDSRVANELIRYLDTETYRQGGFTWRLGWFRIPFDGRETENDRYKDLLYHGSVYVLTSAETFSSAMLFAQWIADNGLGILIGEAPGNTPNGYGEISVFKLPNSQMYMQISTKEFFRADRENPSDLIDPDIVCDAADALSVLYERIT